MEKTSQRDSFEKEVGCSRKFNNFNWNLKLRKGSSVLPLVSSHRIRIDVVVTALHDISRGEELVAEECEGLVIGKNAGVHRLQSCIVLPNDGRAGDSFKLLQPETVAYEFLWDCSGGGSFGGTGWF